MSEHRKKAQLAPRLTTAASLLERGVDLTTLLSSIVDELKTALKADRATLYLVDHGRQEVF